MHYENFFIDLSQISFADTLFILQKITLKYHL